MRIDLKKMLPRGSGIFRYDKAGCKIECRKNPVDNNKTMKLMIARPEKTPRSERATGVLWLLFGCIPEIREQFILLFRCL